MTSNCSTNSVSICENYSYILPFLGELYVVNVWKFICSLMYVIPLSCRLGSGFLKRIPSFLQSRIQLLGSGKGISQ